MRLESVLRRNRRGKRKRRLCQHSDASEQHARSYLYYRWGTTRYVYIYIYVYMCMYIYIYMSVCMYLCIYYIYIYTCIYFFVCASPGGVGAARLEVSSETKSSEAHHELDVAEPERSCLLMRSILASTLACIHVATDAAIHDGRRRVVNKSMLKGAASERRLPCLLLHFLETWHKYMWQPMLPNTA